jgi:ABC-type nitrate/sulfonate/bicarbonate transport system substrate-binding protein
MNSILDLQGRKLGVSGPGAISQVIPELDLAKAGGDPSKVTSVPIGGTSARIAALAAGKIDASQVHTYDMPTLMSASKNLHVIVPDLSGQLPDFIQTFEVASNGALKDKTDALSRYVAGNLLAIRWVHDHPDDAAQLVFDKKWVADTSLDTLKSAYEDYAKSSLLPLNGEVTQADFDGTVKDLVDYHMLSGGTISYADGVDPAVVKGALALVGSVPESQSPSGAPTS